MDPWHLVAFIFVVGPRVLQLNTLTQEIGGYAINLIPMSLRRSTFDPGSWLGEWTIFFWATWISRGRTMPSANIFARGRDLVIGSRFQVLGGRT